ncbi:hypothetical protein [Exiguobacterium acetylicum]|uniref:hypothetical protein n=1 Tax=Exiguobacterium acetylicum TaxID=41170 RepID=UPI001CA63702|nr:hypothetical protein [Exiguobacterium acetylicum]QZY88553.1 hypothetical protein K7G97_16585 [Exiguobacterium acetylicum]
MSKKLIGILLALVVVIGGGIFFFTDGDDKDNKKETSEKVTRDYTETTDRKYSPTRTSVHLRVKAGVEDDKQVQEVLNKVTKDLEKDNLNSLRVTVDDYAGNPKGTFSIAFNKAGMDTAKVDEVGKWVRMP